MTELKAVIFDYYETLAQLQQPARVQLFDDIARQVGRELEPGEAYQQWSKLTTADWKLRLGTERPPTDGPMHPFLSFRDVWSQRFGELFQSWEVDTEGAVGADAYVNLHCEADAYPEVWAALDELRRLCQLAVLSNADDDFLQASLAKNRLEFATVVSSEELRAYKPHVSIFHETCRRIGVAPEQTIYVGDTPWADIEGSRHARMGQAWVNRHGAAWPEDIDPPQHTIASLNDLVALLQ